VPKIVEVHAGRTGFRAGLDPDPPEVGAHGLHTSRNDH
jgi:hypothetical protein